MISKPRTAHLKAPFLVALLALTGLIGACESTPPVQEMSDARQAIAVAKEAGAEEYAASDLSAAEDLLASAQVKLVERSYNLARRDATQAKKKALAALKTSEQQNPPPE